MFNPYRSIDSKIEKIITETSNIKTFTLRPNEKFSFITGQFIELTVPGIGEAPFTPSSSQYKTETIDVTIMNAGTMTSRLHALKEGDMVSIRGPYGKGYPVEKFFGKEVLVLGGGVGFAPLRSLLLVLFEHITKFKKVTLCYGSKTPEDIVYKYLIPEWKKIQGLEIFQSIDKCPEGAKWDGEVGVVTCLLDKVNMDINNSVAVVCGPPIMMKFSTLKLIGMKYKPEHIYLSMERNMSCGLGKCGHCCVGPHFCCKDGPVFTYDQIMNEPEVWA
jgi:NAD(P)H-flavin reductase